MVFTAIFIGTMTLTAYRAVPQQTDSSPFYTSTNEHVRAGSVAVSRDLICGACKKLHRRCDHPEVGKKVHYHDWIYINGIGYFEISDVMGVYTSHKIKGKWIRTPIHNHIDIWVGSLAEEKAFEKRFHGTTTDIWKISAVENAREVH